MPDAKSPKHPERKRADEKMFTKQMIEIFLSVIIMTAVMCFLVYIGYFKQVKVELGHQHYAERVHSSLKLYLPDCIKMPLNTLVNCGYVVLGAAWCAVTSVAVARKEIRHSDAHMFYVFNFLGCCYGPIQALRILTQLHGFSVLDQWYTSPFFMWVFAWGLYLKFGWSSLRNIVLMILSLCSYLLVLFSDIGFEICLSAHVCLAILGAFLAWSKYPKAKCTKCFIGAIISCAGFVVLKLLDFELINCHGVFKYISGHFLSKICDIFQMHFVNAFFLAVTLVACADIKKKEN